MNKLSLILLCTIVSFGSWSQIEISEESDAVVAEKKKEKKKAVESNTGTKVTLYSSWASTSRKLIQNDAPYGDSLFERADEDGLNTWSYGLGIRSNVGDYFSWEIGMNYLRNGESYSFSDSLSDSTLNYQTYYSYVAMPIEAYFKYKVNRFNFFIGGGVVPQLFVNYAQKRQWETATNNPFEDKLTIAPGMNTFALSLKASLGIEFNLGRSTNVFVFPEYRYQLTTSFEKISDFKHFGRAISIKFGLSYQL